MPHFYPRPPRGGRLSTNCERCCATRFLSTPSARRATLPSLPLVAAGEIFLSTPSARRATSTLDSMRPGQSISIHALREEGDRVQRRGGPGGRNFYPRPPRGGRRGRIARESSSTVFLSTPSARRATSCAAAEAWRLTAFLSTPSARRATTTVSCSAVGTKISIHALREEGDPETLQIGSRESYFYPRPPRGGRPE